MSDSDEKRPQTQNGEGFSNSALRDGLQRIAKAAAKAKKPVRNSFSFPAFPRVRLVAEMEDQKVLMNVSEKLEEAKKLMTGVIEAAAEVLAGSVTVSSGALHEAEVQIVDFVLKLPLLEAKRALQGHFFAECLRLYPPTNTGLHRLAKTGYAMGLFRDVTADDVDKPDTIFVLPVRQQMEGDEKSGLVWKQLCVATPGCKESMVALRARTEKSRKGAAEVREKRRKEFRRDTVSLTEALAGKGNAVFCIVPPEGTYPGGELRCDVNDGMVTPIVGTAGIRSLVQKVQQAGITVPLVDATKERLTLQKRLPREKFLLAVVFFHLLRRAYNAEVVRDARIRKYEERKKERRKVYQEETRELLALLPAESMASAADFVLQNAAGQAYLERLGKWDAGHGTLIHGGIHFIAERRADGYIRVAQCPERLAAFFADCRDFQAPDALGTPLNQVLRSIYWRIKKAEERRRDEAIWRSELEEPSAAYRADAELTVSSNEDTVN